MNDVNDANDVAGPDYAVGMAIAALREVLLAGEQFRQAVAEHFHVGVTETLAMSHLAAAGSMTARELSIRVGLTQGAVTTLLDRLETAGLAERNRHPSDRRQIVITPTPSGEELVRFGYDVLVAPMMSIGPERLPDLSETMRTLAAQIRVQAKEIRGKR